MSKKFLKMQATGNDFLILEGDLPKAKRAAAARQFCDRRLGFGADGFLVVEKSSGAFAWDFYNSDGSEAAMCGNAARAVGLYLCDTYHLTEVQFQTKIGVAQAKKVANGEIEVEFTVPDSTPRELPKHSGWWIDTGVPHIVLPKQKLSDRKSLREIALVIKADYRKDGINVTFSSPKSARAIEAITFERGVEEFTLSCGTGALAAARVQLNFNDGHCEVQVPGGKLHVTFRGKRAILLGSAGYIGWCEPTNVSKDKV